MSAFITLDELAAYLSPRAPRDLSGDIVAAIAIEAACGAMRTLSEQELDEGDSTVAFIVSGRESRELILPQMPVISVDEVRVNGEVELEWMLSTGGILKRAATNGTVPVWAEGIIEVDYAHGWPTIPAELRLLALTLAGRAYDQGIARQESVGSSSITYSVAASLDLSTGEKALIAKYRHPKAAVIASMGEAS